MSPGTIRTVAVVENRRIPSAAAAREEVVGECRRRGLHVQDSVGPDTDLIVAIGGDGTVLRAAALVQDSRTLLYGIKHGKVGFLTNTVGDIPAAVERLVSGDFVVSARILLSVTVGSVLDRSLNEVVFQRATCRIGSFSVSADGSTVLAQRADGLIVSTPTGSTAHLLAVGGPVLVPEMEAMAVAPIAAHTLACRPVVLPAGATLSVRSGGPCSVVCDGQREYQAAEGQEVKITIFPGRLNLVFDKDRTFFEKLSEKFGWGL